MELSWLSRVFFSALVSLQDSLDAGVECCGSFLRFFDGRFSSVSNDLSISSPSELASVAPACIHVVYKNCPLPLSLADWSKGNQSGHAPPPHLVGLWDSAPTAAWEFCMGWWTLGNLHTVHIMLIYTCRIALMLSPDTFSGGKMVKNTLAAGVPLD